MLPGNKSILKKVCVQVFGEERNGFENDDSVPIDVRFI